MEKIGAGVGGDVYNVPNEKKVVKVFKYIDNDYDKEEIQPHFLRELYVFNCIKDIPGMIKMYEYDLKKKTITMERLETNLFNYYKKKKDIAFILPTLVKDILYNIIVLQKYNIVHLDIKPTNILLYKKENEDIYHYKLCDFGISKILYNSYVNKNNYYYDKKYPYHPAELNNRRIYNKYTDLYGLCITMIYIITGKEPDNKEMENYKKFLKKYGREDEYLLYILKLIIDDRLCPISLSKKIEMKSVIINKKAIIEKNRLNYDYLALEYLSLFKKKKKYYNNISIGTRSFLVAAAMFIIRTLPEDILIENYKIIPYAILVIISKFYEKSYFKKEDIIDECKEYDSIERIILKNIDCILFDYNILKVANKIMNSKNEEIVIKEEYS